MDWPEACVWWWRRRRSGWRRRRRGRRCRRCCRGGMRSSTCSGCCRSCTRCRAVTTRGCARRCRIAGISRRARRSCRCCARRWRSTTPTCSARSCRGPVRRWRCSRGATFVAFEQLLAALYERAGCRHGSDARRCTSRRRPWRTLGVRPRENGMKFVAGLTCHLCGATYPAEALWVCECLGPLEVTYDYDAIRKVISRTLIESRPPSLWRYLELLPVEEPKTGFNSGFTPLVKATRLARELGVAELYIKDDSVNHPTFSYKDRVVSVAATRAVELGFQVFGCASTGNLAGSVAAHAARLGLPCYVFIPHDLEPAKVLGAAIYRPHGRCRRRQLRRREPAVHADRRSVRLGIRQHQPAQLLRRRREDDGLRDRRAARLALSRSHRVAGGRRHAAAAHLQGTARAAGRSASSKGSCRGSTRRSRRGRRRSSTRSRRGSSFPIRSSRTRSPSRSPSATRPTDSRW